jgi:hypothetical protein
MEPLVAMRSQCESIEDARAKVYRAYRLEGEVTNRTEFDAAIIRSWKSVFTVCGHEDCRKCTFRSEDPMATMCVHCTKMGRRIDTPGKRRGCDIPPSVVRYARAVANDNSDKDYDTIIRIYNADILQRINSTPDLDVMLNMWMASDWACRVCGNAVDLLFTAYTNKCVKCKDVTGIVCYSCDNDMKNYKTHDLNTTIANPRHARLIWDHVARYTGYTGAKSEEEVERFESLPPQGYFPGGPTDLKLDEYGKHVTPPRGTSGHADLDRSAYWNKNMIFLGAPARCKPPREVQELLRL